MKLKKSYYNMMLNIPNNKSQIIFNTSTCALGIMDEESQKLYDKIEEINLNNITEKEKTNIDLMKENGFILDSAVDEYSKMQIESLKAKFNTNSSKALSIAPTMNCNMACPYCYETQTSELINEEVESYIYEFIKEFIKDASSFAINWYGGEPLLAQDIIYRISKKVIKLCEEQNIDYYSDMVTNGTLLTKEVAINLRENCKVEGAQITIDGLEKTHNMRRKLKDNRLSSFQQIIQNIDDVKDILDISIRINVDEENMNEIPQLISYFIEEKEWLNKNKIRFYFAPVVKKTEKCNVCINSCIDMEELKSLYYKISDIIKDKLDINYLSEFFPERKLISCGAVTLNNYVIDPKGDLFKCWSLISDNRYCVGNVKTGIVINQVHSKWLLSNHLEWCKVCKLMPVCQGGCLQRSLEKPNEKNCSIYEYMIEDIIRSKYEDLIKISDSN